MENQFPFLKQKSPQEIDYRNIPGLHKIWGYDSGWSDDRDKKKLLIRVPYWCGSNAWPVASEEVNLFPAFAPVVCSHNLI